MKLDPLTWRFEPPTAKSHQYTVLWKQPVVENKRLPIDPVFPETCNLVETAPPELTGNALIKRWQASCDLSTATIEISGLRTSITDVLVRVIRWAKSRKTTSSDRVTRRS